MIHKQENTNKSKIKQLISYYHYDEIYQWYSKKIDTVV